jgi:phage replication O-like protein O
MASPQTENGCTWIANELMEALAKMNLRPYETRVLFFVLRKTYGFHKKMDRISVSQIAQGTGLHKQHASRARRTLLEKRLLIDRGGQIGPNKNYDEWQIDGKKVTGTGDAKVTGTGYTVAQKVTGLGAKVTGTGYKTSLKQAPQKQKATNKSKKAASTDFAFVLRSKKLWHLPQAKLDQYKATFPNLDVEVELRKAAQWLIDNPGRRKTATGMTRYVSGWLGRAKPGLEGGGLTTRDATDADIEAFEREGILR